MNLVAACRVGETFDKARQAMDALRTCDVSEECPMKHAALSQPATTAPNLAACKAVFCQMDGGLMLTSSLLRSRSYCLSSRFNFMAKFASEAEVAGGT